MYVCGDTVKNNSYILVLFETIVYMTTLEQLLVLCSNLVGCEILQAVLGKRLLWVSANTTEFT